MRILFWRRARHGIFQNGSQQICGYVFQKYLKFRVELESLFWIDRIRSRIFFFFYVYLNTLWAYQWHSTIHIHNSIRIHFALHFVPSFSDVIKKKIYEQRAHSHSSSLCVWVLPTVNDAREISQEPVLQQQTNAAVAAANKLRKILKWYYELSKYFHLHSTKGKIPTMQSNTLTLTHRT